MLRKLLIALVAVLGLAGAACSGGGPTDPMPPTMPMQVVAADTVAS